jgi:hypothetical protein
VSFDSKQSQALFRAIVNANFTTHPDAYLLYPGRSVSMWAKTDIHARGVMVALQSSLVKLTICKLNIDLKELAGRAQLRLAAAAAERAACSSVPFGHRSSLQTVG